MHEWAREGIEVKKEPVLRHVYDIQVVRYKFPYLSVRVTVSSGTYVRTLFNHMSNELGTIGSLIALSREKIGEITSAQGLKMKDWPQERRPEIIQNGLRVDKVLPFSEVILNETQTKAFKNGAFLRPSQLSIKPNGKLSEKLFWMLDEEQNLLGLGEQTFPEELKPKINFHSVDPTEP
jgi:tRNA U55 pseudouridine synthase TruB